MWKLEERDLKFIKEVYKLGKIDGWKVEINKENEEWKVKITIFRKDWQHPFEWDAWFSEFKEEIPFSLFKKVAIYEAFKFCFAEELERLEEKISQEEILGQIPKEVEKQEEREVKEETHPVKEEVWEEEFYQGYEERIYEPSFESIEEEYIEKEALEELEKSYEVEPQLEFQLEAHLEPREEFVEEEGLKELGKSQETTYQQKTPSQKALEDLYEEAPKIKKSAKITLEQMQLIAKLLPNKSHKQRLKKISRIIGREVNTYGEITYEEAEVVIKELQKART